LAAARTKESSLLLGEATPHTPSPLHVQPKAGRKFRLKDKSKKRSPQNRFIPIPAKLVWKIKDRMRQRDAMPHD